MISNYDDFTTEYALLQRDIPTGVGLARTLLIKRLVFMRVGISGNARTWNVPPKVLNEIIDILKRSKK